MKKKMTAVFAVFLTLILTISQAVSVFAETADQQADDAFADGTYTIPAETDQRMFYIVSDEDQWQNCDLDGQRRANDCSLFFNRNRI